MLNPANQIILYTEDDENDAFLLQHALSKAGVSNPLKVMASGKAAIEYLSAAAGRAHLEFPLPCLVLLDLNMPGTSGLDVLKWIRATPGISTLIVVMLTSSNQESDIHRAYVQGANGYLVKPSRLDDTITLARAIKDFWLLQNHANGGLPKAPLQAGNGNLPPA